MLAQRDATIVQKCGAETDSVTRISSVSTHKFLLVQFASDLNVRDKTIIICFAKKIFGTYFEIPLKDLIRCDGGMSSALRAIDHASHDSRVALHVGRK